MCVYCAVRTECLNVIQACVSLHSVQAVGMPACCYRFPLKGCDVHVTRITSQRMQSETVEEPYRACLMLPGAAVTDPGSS
jgi:hypothetical protein